MSPDSPDLPWLAELNPDQRKAVTHEDGPILVVAGAGSGKTKTLACRVAWLIANGIDPARILLLTFTRRASEEMVKRATAMASQNGALAGKVWGGTFHSTANRLLRIYAKAAGLDNDFTVMDEADSADLLNVVRHDLDLASKDKRFPKKATCLAIYSRCVNGAEDLELVLRRFFPWCAMWQTELKSLFKAYVSKKLERGVLDFDDLLIYWEQLVSDDGMAAEIGKRFDHVLVDEYQDTNPVQSRILAGMRKFNKNIMVVGDDAQSIYSFRAATVRNMLDFPKQFPGTTIVTLSQNYRSVMPILESTNLVIAQSKERFTKDLWSTRATGQRPKLVICEDEANQDEFVIKTVLEHYEQGIPLRKQAVLFRTGHHSDSLEIALTRKNIAYHKYGGLRFLEAAHVKDLVSFLRVIENPRDEIAWFRILQLIDGIGPAVASRAIEHVRVNHNVPGSIGQFAAPAAAREGIAGLGKLMETLSATRGKTPAPDVECIRKFYDPLLEKRYDNPGVRRRDLENLERIAAGYRSRRSFLTDLTLDPPTSTSDLAGAPFREEDWLVLSTVHSAKGCEWDVVIIIHAADGCMPSDMATGSAEEIEEELRLMYVAMTRARDFLYVAWPLRYYHKWHGLGDAHSYAQRSRFLTEKVCATFDHLDLCRHDPDDSATDFRGRVNIASRIKSRWD
ncbi:MAG: ATP-dependent helicase [bacterium]